MPGNTMEGVAEKSIRGELGIARFGTCNQLYAGSVQALPVG
jgi:hypothetical protein